MYLECVDRGCDLAILAPLWSVHHDYCFPLCTLNTTLFIFLHGTVSSHLHFSFVSVYVCVLLSLAHGHVIWIIWHKHRKTQTLFSLSQLRKKQDMGSRKMQMKFKNKRETKSVQWEGIVRERHRVVFPSWEKEIYQTPPVTKTHTAVRNSENYNTNHKREGK